MKNITVYALILNYNSALDTINIYRQLKKLDVKILVLDNNSSKVDLEILIEAIPSEELLKNTRNIGYARGNNVGITKAVDAGADYIWILNPDIKLTEGTLSSLLHTIENDPALAAVGPRIIRGENKNIIFSDGGTVAYDNRCHADHKNYGKLVKDNLPYINYDVDYLDGSCLFIRAKALSQLGLLPEQYFLYFEETHWCVNASRLGWKLAANLNTTVYNQESPRNATYFFYTFRNRLLFAKEFHPNSKIVVNYYIKLLFKQTLRRILRIEHPPFLKLRIKALISAIRNQK